MMLASRLVREQHLVRPRWNWPTDADQERNAASTDIPVTTLTAGTPAFTEGSWVQLIASTTVESTWIEVWSAAATFGSAANGTMLLDLAIGDGAGNPVSTLVDSYQIGYQRLPYGIGLDQVPTVMLPLNIPQGVQVLGRIQSGIASDTCQLALQLYGGNAAPVFRNCTTYGAVTASARGTILTKPGADNTKGAWTQISAAITNPVYAAGFGVGGGGNTTFSAITAFIDIGAGSAGNERVVVPDLMVGYTTNEATAYDTPKGHLARNLAQPLGVGERLAARYAESAIVAAQDVDLIVYGWS